MAGESAREFARRQRAKAERHARVADAYERGADGESITGAVLDRLSAAGWVILHDQPWPGRPRANIDHIAIGPGGLFVIDSKNWSGHISVDGDVLRQGTRRREEAVAGVAQAALAVTEVTAIAAAPVLCFVRDEPLAGWARDVMICSTANVIEMLSSRPPVLHPEAVKRTVRRLQTYRSATGTARAPVPNRMSVRPPAGRPRTVPRRRPSRHRSLLRTLLAGLAMLMVLAIAGPMLIAALTSGIQAGVKDVLDSHDVPIGTRVQVDGASGRPSLAVTAVSVSEAQARGARSVAPGKKLLVVHLKFENTGSVPWSLSNGHTTLHDRAGIPLTGSAIRRTSAGAAFDAAATVAAGQVLEGLVVFEAPRGAAPGDVVMSIGPGLAKTVRWTAAPR